MTEAETGALLKQYDLQLNDSVKQKYDGYLFNKTEMYNPWSVLNYAENERLENYWVNTSTNSLIHESLKGANDNFLNKYYQLIENGSIEVGVKLDTSFIELKNEYTLWGLLVNSGYLTIYHDTPGSMLKKVRIPNEEVKSEFQSIIAEQALAQILEQRYYAGLTGKVLCMGIAHNKKRCEIAHQMIEL